jgi:nucleoside-diphosphate-sugar epimerase
LTILRAGTDSEIAQAVHESHAELVLHTACSYGRAGESTLQILDANVRFGMLLLEAAKSLGGAAFLNTGSALDPEVSAYALTKRQFSQWGCLEASHAQNGLRFIDIRLQHMYGPGDDASKFTTHVIRSCARNVPALSLTAGEQQRDFIYIDDVLSAYERLAGLALEQPAGRVSIIELGSGEAPTLRHFVETVHQLSGSRTRLDFGALPYRPNEAMLCRADLTAMRALGWTPRYDLRAGIARTLELERINTP